MGRMSIDIPTALKKIEPKTGTLRRTSTGNSSIKTNEPNHLRVSTSSCKYDIKRAIAAKPWRPVGRILDKNADISLDNNRKGMKALTSPKMMSSVSSRQKPKTCKTDIAFSRIVDKNVSLDKDHRGKKALKQHNELLKPKASKPVTISHQPAPKQPIRTSLTSSKRESQNDDAAEKEVKNNPMKINSTRRLSSPKLPTTAKSRTDKKDSQPEIKNKTCNVTEKIIHVVDQEDHKSPVQESHMNCTTLGSSQESNNRKKATEIPPEENYSTPKKTRLNRGKVPAAVMEKIGNDRSSLRRPVCEGKAVSHKKNETTVLRHQYAGWKNGDSVLLNIVLEERASNLVKMRKTKVEALVGAFQSVITRTQHSSSSSS